MKQSQDSNEIYWYNCDSGCSTYQTFRIYRIGFYRGYLISMKIKANGDIRTPLKSKIVESFIAEPQVLDCEQITQPETFEVYGSGLERLDEVKMLIDRQLEVDWHYNECLQLFQESVQLWSDLSISKAKIHELKNELIEDEKEIEWRRERRKKEQNSG